MTSESQNKSEITVLISTLSLNFPLASSIFSNNMHSNLHFIMQLEKLMPYYVLTLQKEL